MDPFLAPAFGLAPPRGIEMPIDFPSLVKSLGGGAFGRQAGVKRYRDVAGNVLNDELRGVVIIAVLMALNVEANHVVALGE
jgi:hypothetical protein